MFAFLKDQQTGWLTNNTTGRYMVTSWADWTENETLDSTTTFQFEKEEDAIMFALKWGNIK